MNSSTRYSKDSLSRTLANLTRSGVLEKSPEGLYTLGPAAIATLRRVAKEVGHREGLATFAAQVYSENFSSDDG